MKKQLTVAEAKQALTEATEARHAAYAAHKSAETAEFAARDAARKAADLSEMATRIKHANAPVAAKRAAAAAAKAVEAKAALTAAKEAYEMAQAAEDKAEDTLAEAVDQAAFVQPEPVEVTVTETQETQEEETDMSNDPYAQDRADGKAQEKREAEIFASIDTGAGPRPIIAADDKDSADEAAKVPALRMRFTVFYTPDEDEEGGTVQVTHRAAVRVYHNGQGMFPVDGTVIVPDGTPIPDGRGFFHLPNTPVSRVVAVLTESEYAADSRYRHFDERFEGWLDR